MDLVALKVESKEETGSGPARRMRAAGVIPGVVYGLGRETVAVAVPRREFERIYVGSEGSNTLIDLDVPGQEHLTSVAAMIKVVQRDPVSRAMLNIDFQWVSLRELIHVEVPIHLEGRAPGVADGGGMVQQHLHTLTINCLPTDIPERISVSIEGMQIGDALHVRDLPVLPGVVFLLDGDEAVLNIARPITGAELEAPVGEEGVETLVDIQVAEEKGAAGESGE